MLHMYLTFIACLLIVKYLDNVPSLPVLYLVEYVSTLLLKESTPLPKTATGI